RVAVAKGGARDDAERDEAEPDRREEDDEGALLRRLHRAPPAACASSQRRRITEAASRSITSRRRARERSASSSTSSASTVLKLSSMRSTGTDNAARKRSAKVWALLAARPTSPSGVSGSPSTTRSASSSRTSAAM